VGLKLSKVKGIQLGGRGNCDPVALPAGGLKIPSGAVGAVVGNVAGAAGAGGDTKALPEGANWPKRVVGVAKAGADGTIELRGGVGCIKAPGTSEVN
jgi:hypothetical protein